MNDKRFETWWAITTAPDGEIWIKNRLHEAKVVCLNLGGGVVEFVHGNTADRERFTTGGPTTHWRLVTQPETEDKGAAC